MSSHSYYNTGRDGLVVVQGTPVIASGHGVYKPTPQSGNQYRSNGEYQPQKTGHGDYQSQQEITHVHHGQRQQKRCNDVLFAVLFYAHLGVMAWTTARYAPTMMSDAAEAAQDAYQNRRLDEGGDGGGNNGEIEFDMAALWLILGVSAAAGLSLSILLLSVMMSFAETLIKIALLFNVVTPLLMAILALLTGAIPVALLCFMLFAFTCYYAFKVWSRIPFAAANMRTAVSAVRANLGLAFFAFNSLFLSFFWTLWWAIATTSTIYVTSGCSAEGCESEPSGPLVFGLLLSYFWTVQVIKNVCHTTVCGTVGTWWYNPEEASSCCSKAVCDSFFRSVTYSFGSICMGSLLVALIQTIKEMAHQAREQGDSALLCCAECILSCIESLVEYFNKWAYVYVALYNYSFIEAGKGVIGLFKERGWTAIISDLLIDGVLGMVSFAVGAITGVIVALAVAASGLSLAGAEGPSAFLVGFMMGALFASTLLGIVGSAVNTVIVCYAEAPNEFQQNHPQLSEEMRASWRAAWPNDFTY